MARSRETSLPVPCEAQPASRAKRSSARSQTAGFFMAATYPSRCPPWGKVTLINFPSGGARPGQHRGGRRGRPQRSVLVRLRMSLNGDIRAGSLFFLAVGSVSFRGPAALEELSLE